MGLPLLNVQLIVVTSVFMAVAIFSVALRLTSRFMKRVRLDWSDFWIIVALIILCGECGIVLNEKSHIAVGVEDGSLKAADRVKEGKTYMASDILWVSVMATIKMSILHLYLAIFHSKRFSWIVYGVMAVNVAWWIAMVIEELTICQPINYTWNKTIEGHCGSTIKAYIAEAVINVFMDAVVIVLPMPLLWRLHMQLHKKIMIMGMFSLGIVVVVISCLRIDALTKLDSGDVQKTSFFTDLFSVLEPCLGIVNACLPVMHPIYSKITSYEIIPSLKSMLSSRSFHRSAGSNRNTLADDDYNKTGSSKNSAGLHFGSNENTQVHEARHFNRMYDAMMPATMTGNMSRLSGETIGPRGGRFSNPNENLIQVDFEVDVTSRSHSGGTTRDSS